MAMPDKATHRPLLVAAVEVAELDLFKVPAAQARVLLALADAEWSREEAAAKEAVTLPPPA